MSIPTPPPGGTPNGARTADDMFPVRLLALVLVVTVALVLIFPERTRNLVALVEAFAWPLAVMLGIILFRSQIPELARGIGGRIKGVSIPPLSIELVTAEEVAPAWVVPAPGPSDVRGLTPAMIFDSNTAPLFAQIATDTSADYAVIDLESGHSWLTTRLFIFSVVLSAVNGLRCFVFLETTSHGRRQWLGNATPEAVRMRLGARYPWMEESLRASFDIVQQGRGESAMQSEVAMDLVRQFLQNPLVQVRGAQPSDDWLPVREPNRTGGSMTGDHLWEHSAWLDGEQLSQVLGPGLDHDAWVAEVPGDPAATETAIVHRDGRFVAVVANGWRFRRLVDRPDLLERVATQLVNGR